VLFEPNETPFDLRWTMFGIPVRVHPLFWLVSVIMGWTAFREGGIVSLLLWVACVFVSILVHELGHVLMGKSFGSHGHIVLYSFGGLAVGSNRLSDRWQRVAVCFAGPLAGFLLLGVVVGGVALFSRELFSYCLASLCGMLEIPYSLDVVVQDSYLTEVLRDLIWINLFWGLVNLLPVWPLDGGQIAREVCTYFSRRNGVRISLQISIAAALVIAVNAVLPLLKLPSIPFVPSGGLYVAILFAMLAVGSFQALQMEGQRPHSGPGSSGWTERRDPWERDADWWKSGRDPWNT
jgi:stage IV sporulation protein FB